MIVMAWPVGMKLSTPGPIVFFLAATVWFVLVAARVVSGDTGRLINGYHAMMMAAVAWLYAVMIGGPLGKSSDHTMPGMDMSVPETTQPGWITTLDWVVAAGFACAAVYWLYHYIAERKTNSARLGNWGTLCHVCMACGMAIMFAVIL